MLIRTYNNVIHRTACMVSDDLERLIGHVCCKKASEANVLERVTYLP